MGRQQNRQQPNGLNHLDPRPTFEEVVVRRSPKPAKPSNPSANRAKSNSPVQPTVEELPPQPSAKPSSPRSQLHTTTDSARPNSRVQSSVEEFSAKRSQLNASPQTPDSGKTPYTEQTQRIVAWSNLLRSLQPFIWVVVILVVIVPLVGKTLLFSFLPDSVQPIIQPLTEVIVPVIPRRNHLDNALVDAVQTAHESAEAFAKTELDDWELQLEGRVDHFLDWYFGYFNQKKMELSTPLVWATSAALRTLNPKQMTASEAVVARFTEEFQKQFAKQVLVPQTAQIRLENLTTETINYYLLALRQNMNQVQLKYRVPQGQWDRYLSDISTTIQDTEGNLSNFSLKMLIGGSGYLLTKPMILATAGKVGSAVSSKFAGTAAAKLAAKTGGTVAAELGTSLIDPIVGVGIFIWDIWDYQHTVELERPLLKANLLDYLRSVEQSLLNAPETGVLSAIDQLEQGIFQSL